jgi:methionyl-tRNA formyltransferase
MNPDLEFWFAGSGRLGARCFSLLMQRIRFRRVITAVPRPAGRKLAHSVTPVEMVASAAGVDVSRTLDISGDPVILERLQEEKPFCIFVVDFSQMVREPLLSLPEPGCLNIHPSMLPAYRGAAPIQRAIMNGENRTGVTVFRLAKEMDSGPILVSSQLDIGPDDTFGDLLDLLAVEGSSIAMDGLELLSRGRISFREQDHGKASFAPRISKQETELSWEKPSRQVHDLVRSLNPDPGSFVLIKGKRLKIWKTVQCEDTGRPGEILGFRNGDPVIGCGSGSVQLAEVQTEGRKRTDGGSWLRGTSLEKGDILE